MRNVIHTSKLSPIFLSCLESNREDQQTSNSNLNVRRVLWTKCLCPPQTSYIKALIPNNNTNVMVLEVGPSEGD